MEELHDRDGMFDYTAERSGDLEVAFRADAKLEETFEQIAANPKIGHTRSDLGIPEDLRVRRVYSYLVIYDPATSPVQILRVWHGAQEKLEISKP